MSTPLEQRAPVKPGDVLAEKYVVERVLGVGGMGVVVLAQHRYLGGKVALKFVLPEYAMSELICRRFLKEAQAATQITGEHVARVSDVGVLDGGLPYMVMEYLDGKDLSSVLAERGPLPLAEAVDYLLQALQAIAEAHAKGIVHRDLKPSNLFLTRRAGGSPLVKVLDFGIAKALASGATPASDLTSTSGVVGSPLYMSPEQIRSSKDVDTRTDIWSIGVILHELLTRTYPFLGDTAAATLAAIVTEPPVPARRVRPDLPEQVERVILGCLEKDSARRLPSVAAIAELLSPFGSADATLSRSRIADIAAASGQAPLAAGSALASAAADAPAVASESAGSASTNADFGGTVPDAALRAQKKRATVVGLGLAVVGLLLLVGGGLFVFLRPAATSEDAVPAASMPESPAPPAPQAPLPAPPPASVTPESATPAPVASQAIAPARSAAAAPAARPAAKKIAAPASPKSVAPTRAPAKKVDDVGSLIERRH